MKTYSEFFFDSFSFEFFGEVRFVEGGTLFSAPMPRQQLRLPQYRFRRGFLFVRRVAVFAQSTLDEYAQFCAHAFFYRPINRGVV